MKKKKVVSVFIVSLLLFAITSCSTTDFTSDNNSSTEESLTSEIISSESSISQTSSEQSSDNTTSSDTTKYGILEISSEIYHGSVSFVGYDNFAKVPLGTKVYIDYESDEGYYLKSLKVNNISILNELSFYVEDETTYTLTALFAENIISTEEKQGTISFQNLKSGTISLDNLILDNIKISSVSGNYIFLDSENSSNILRISSSNNGGNITFDLENEYSIYSIELVGDRWSGDETKVSITLNENTITQSYTDSLFNFNEENVSKIKISTAKGQRYLLEKIIVNYTDNSSSMDPVPATLSVMPCENGDVSVQYLNDELYVGDLINIIAQPDDGYYTSSVKINGYDANVISTNNYSYKIKEQKNTLEVKFSQKSTGSNDYDYLYGNTQIFPDRGNQSVSYDDYYESVRGLKGQALKDGLNAIIDDHTEYSYDGNDPRFRIIDVDPFNSNNMIFMYEGSLSNTLSYNNEHCWAKSHGNFGTSKGPGSDLHNLRPSDPNLNSTRGNLDFGGVNNFSKTYSWWRPSMDGNKIGSYFEPKDEFKGDIARIIFYMATRYDGKNGEVDLEVSGNIDKNLYYDFTSGADGLHGDFAYLYEWATSGIDPVSDYEVNRNNICDQQYQHNRNPFIDHPEFIIMIYDKNYDGPGALM